MADALQRDLDVLREALANYRRNRIANERGSAMCLERIMRIRAAMLARDLGASPSHEDEE